MPEECTNEHQKARKYVTKHEFDSYCTLRSRPSPQIITTPLTRGLTQRLWSLLPSPMLGGPLERRQAQASEGQVDPSTANPEGD